MRDFITGMVAVLITAVVVIYVWMTTTATYPLYILPFSVSLLGVVWTILVAGLSLVKR